MLRGLFDLQLQHLIRPGRVAVGEFAEGDLYLAAANMANKVFKNRPRLKDAKIFSTTHRTRFWYANFQHRLPTPRELCPQKKAFRWIKLREGGIKNINSLFSGVEYQPNYHRLDNREILSRKPHWLFVHRDHERTDSLRRPQKSRNTSQNGLSKRSSDQASFNAFFLSRLRVEPSVLRSGKPAE